MSIHHSFESKFRAMELYQSGVGSDSVGRELGVSKDQLLRWVKAYVMLGAAGLSKQAYLQLPEALKAEIVSCVLEKVYLAMPLR